MPQRRPFRNEGQGEGFTNQLKKLAKEQVNWGIDKEFSEIGLADSQAQKGVHIKGGVLAAIGMGVMVIAAVATGGAALPIIAAVGLGAVAAYNGVHYAKHRHRIGKYTEEIAKTVKPQHRVTLKGKEPGLEKSQQQEIDRTRSQKAQKVVRLYKVKAAVA